MKRSFITIVVAFIFLFTSKAEQSVYTIKTNSDGPVQYCNSSFEILPLLTIEGTPMLNGMKVSISEGYIAGQDELYIEGNTGTVTKTWYEQQGYLVLSGGTSVKEYEDAIRLIKYKNKKSVPTLGTRKITISMLDADYLPATGHFYRYIYKPGISWSNAKAEAQSDAMKYYGMTGYLATITSKDEDDFIRQKTSGMGWIGASDAETENMWKWVTGPEGLNGGTLFWKGTGYLAKTNPSNYGLVSGFYHNWNRWNEPYSSSTPSSTWEPNQSGNEDYGHISLFPNNVFAWNDLPNAGGSSSPYLPQGYIIEYGGMPNDPVINLTATIELQVNTVQFDSKRDFTTCSGDTVRLNKTEKTATYIWSPDNGTLSDPTVSDPVAGPDTTTVYSVTGTRGICKDSALFTVNANPLPISLLHDNENICIGNFITLDPGIHYSYLWSNGINTRTISVNEPGKYSVQLTTDKNCKLKDSVDVFTHEYPKLDLTELDTLVCGQKNTSLIISTDKGNYSLESSDASVSINGLNVSVPIFGTFPFYFKATDQYSCSTDTAFTVGFHKIPTISLSVDSATCYGYNIDAQYIGDANTDQTRFTWVFGGDTITDTIGADHEIIPLGINKTNRDLVLTIEQQGCNNITSLNDIKVIPDLNLSVKDSLGCEPFNAEFLATNTENVAKYDWEWGDGQLSQTTIGNETHQYISDGYYNVKLTATTDKGCNNWIKIDSMVYAAPIPTIGFSLSPDECLNAGENQVLYVGSADSNDNYQWDLSAFDPEEIIQNPGNTQGPFIFDLKNKPKTQIGLQVVSKYGCFSTDSVISVKRKPVFDFTANAVKGCSPLSILFQATINDPVDQAGFSWDFGDNTTGSGSQPDHIYEIPDQQYNISLLATSSETNCTDELTKQNFITVHPNPVATFTMDHDIVYNDAPVVQFINQSVDATDYLWDFGNGNNSTEENPEYRFPGIGRQNVLLNVFNEFMCSDTTTHEILVAFNKIFTPNAFSPNAPNEIDREFKLASSGIKEEGYHLRIISRWNDLVFETKDKIVGWDGKSSNGQNAQPGNYVWVLEYIDFLERSHQQTGTVTLIY